MTTEKTTTEIIIFVRSPLKSAQNSHSLHIRPAVCRKKQIISFEEMKKHD